MAIQDVLASETKVEQTQRGYSRHDNKGIMIKVESYEGEGTKDSPVIIHGTAYVGDKDGLAEKGEAISVRINPERFKGQQIEKLIKDELKRSGAVLGIDSAYRDAGGMLNGGWVNTIISSAGILLGDESHLNREVIHAVTQVPSVVVQNVKPEPNEPQGGFVWPINKDTMEVQTDDGVKTFDRQWLKQKMSEAQAAGQSPKVSLTALRVEDAVPVSSKEEVKAFIQENAANGESFMLRFFDQDSGMTVEGMCWNRMDRNPETMMGDIDASLISRQDGNPADPGLWQEVANGGAKAEIIPVYNIRIAGQTLTKTLKSFTDSSQARAINSFGKGEDTYRYASTFLPVRNMNPGQENEFKMLVGNIYFAGGLRTNDPSEINTPNYTYFAKPQPPKVENEAVSGEATAEAQPEQSASEQDVVVDAPTVDGDDVNFDDEVPVSKPEKTMQSQLRNTM